MRPFVLSWTREHVDGSWLKLKWAGLDSNTDITHKKLLINNSRKYKKRHNDFVFCSVLDHSQYHGQLSVVLPLWWPVGDHLCMDVWYRSVWTVHHVHHVPYSVLEEKSSQVSHKHRVIIIKSYDGCWYIVLNIFHYCIFEQKGKNLSSTWDSHIHSHTFYPKILILNKKACYLSTLCFLTEACAVCITCLCLRGFNND